MDDSPFRGPLWYALAELGVAADAQDQEAVEDLAAEVGALLHPVATAGSGPADVPSVLLELWGDLQYAIGRLYWPEMALAASTLRLATGPAPAGPRPANAAPPYRPAGHRIPPDDHVPLIDLAALRPLPTDPGLVFLRALPEALNTCTGHLVDPETARAPRGARVERVGWRTGEPGPSNIRMGSLMPGGQAVVALDPTAAVAAVNAVTAVHGDVMRLDVGSVAAALGSARLMDTTLIVGPNDVTRQLGVNASIMDGGPESWHWQLPLSTWHQRQFYARHPPAVAPSRTLRLVRDIKSE